MEDKKLKAAEKLGVQGGIVVGILYSLLIVAVCYSSLTLYL